MPDPDPDIMFAHAYALPHQQVEQERATFAAYLASFENAEQEVGS